MYDSSSDGHKLAGLLCRPQCRPGLTLRRHCTDSPVMCSHAFPAMGRTMRPRKDGLMLNFSLTASMAPVRNLALSGGEGRRVGPVCRRGRGQQRR